MPDKKSKLSASQREAQFIVLRAIHEHPLLSQRELSSKLGISLGKTNYCVQALVKKGWIKTRNFKNNKNKAAYTYLLTSKGLEQKWTLARAFLKLKRHEFESLRREIHYLEQETLKKSK